MNKILVIDDDTKLRNLLSAYFNTNGFDVFVAESAMRARELIAANDFDLLIVDVMMKGETGFEFTKNIRKISKIPILMLTAKGDIESRIEGLELGADDYLTKPFEPKELLLRAKKLIDRNGSNSRQHDNEGEIKFGDHIFNLTSRILNKQTESGSEQVDISSKEGDLLYLFCKNINVPISRLEISTAFHGISERSVDVQVARLRKKIEADPQNPRHIHTNWGMGYVFRT